MFLNFSLFYFFQDYCRFPLGSMLKIHYYYQYYQYYYYFHDYGDF